MKKSLLLLAAFLAPLAAIAAIQPGAQSNVALSLFRYASEPVSETSVNTKIVKYSYGSRALLAELLDEGVLGEGQTLAGWNLVIVDRTPLTEQDGNTLIFYAVKKGVTPVQIPASRLYLNANSNAGADGDTYKMVEDEPVFQKSSFKAIVSLSGHTMLNNGEDDYDYSFSLQALASGSDTRGLKKIKVGTVTETFDYTLLGAINLKPVLGIYTDNLADSEDSQTPVEGSVTFSAFTPLDISGYPFED